ncbi:hypothetical protein ACFPOD_03590 [Nitratireductor kimnyeongensis]|uniref:DUF4089 domain-containing protein n=1 Tax=Nitratireductor kimnyeongensis TaxID=430679 RepID=A0ABW0T503_9HYPH|nr:hypothetical protein [Nitratireductor kimnyeongensis]QZZ34816.1 hypothetical protein KW403_13595 [Nitratireductor kimnyeongensis]
MTIPAYTAEMIADLADRHKLPLPQERRDAVAATLTHVRSFIATLQSAQQGDEAAITESNFHGTV